MRIINEKQLGIGEILGQLRSTRSDSADVKERVLEIMEDVKKRGDKALFELTARFDKAQLETLKVSPEEIAAAYGKVDKSLVQALKRAQENIAKFHKTTFCKKGPKIETQKGVNVWQEFRPIENVGFYVPGGTAAYPSTVLMLGVPANLAGCKKIVMCSPPLPNGEINPSILVAADLCGITDIFKVGGAQAVAAMAYGTETIPKVYKIFGPGNQYVSTAKMLVYGQVDIDMPAGPSEVLIIADESAKPSSVAGDLLSQLEHGTDSQAVLVTFSEDFAREVIKEMQKQMQNLPRREIIEESFAKSFAVVVDSVKKAVEVANEYAPEHLEIVMRTAKSENAILAQINNAGSVFLGKWASEPVGDYVSGSNHTLPTSGYAKMFSGLSASSFGKYMQIQRISKGGLEKLRKTVEVIAGYEGLQAHAAAVTNRFKK
ncbi:MAG: histidinol dehydrogenase [Candidatus Gracilibacteria bacterium]